MRRRWSASGISATAPEFSPTAHGFEYFFGLKSGYHDFYAHTAGDGKPDLWENDRQVVVEGYTTDLITERSVRFLEQHAARPFFLEIAYNAPHWPYQPPDRPSVAPGNARHVRPWDDQTSTRADYVAMVERVDRGVGEVLRALDRLDLTRRHDRHLHQRQRRRVAVEQRAAVQPQGERLGGRHSRARADPLARTHPAGKVSGQVGITMDLTASILAATGAHGAGRHAARWHRPVPDAGGPRTGGDRGRCSGGRAIRRTQQWAVRSGDWKLVLDGASPFVFNVRTDPGERENLTSQRQDVARRLRPLLAAWEADVDAEWKRAAPQPPVGTTAPVPPR